MVDSKPYADYSIIPEKLECPTGMSRNDWERDFVQNLKIINVLRHDFQMLVNLLKRKSTQCKTTMENQLEVIQIKFIQ